jgi:DNA-binding response OmpR family regulator
VGEAEIKGARILIVDDEEESVRLLERILERAHYTRVRSTTDPNRVVELFRDHEPDLVLLDLRMPGKDGLEVLAELRAEVPESTYLPVLVLTADPSIESRRRALVAGAKDFVTKPFDDFEVLLRIWNLLETRLMYLALQRAAAGGPGAA